MDARQLVGMTEGAKKRWARVQYMRATYEVLRLFSSWDAAAEQYKYARSMARIGTKLRPCPGKHGCLNCTPTCGACEDEIPDDTKCKRCGSVMTTEGPFCDGSGVVSAKPKKVRR